MRRRSFVGAGAAALLTRTASARLSLTGTGSPIPGAPPSYAGPGDIATFSAWYGLRAYSAAIAAAATQTLGKFRRDSDNATADIVVATNGGLGVTANATAGSNGVSITSWAGGAGLWCEQMHDQTGNGHIIGNGTTSQQPQLVMAGGPSGALPALVFVSANFTLLGTASTFLLATPKSLSAVVKATAAGGYVLSHGTTPLIFYFPSPGPDQLILHDGNYPVVTATLNAWHALQGIGDATVGAVVVDGTSTAALNASVNETGYLAIGGALGGPGNFDGSMCEVGVASATDITSVASGLNSNQHTYWGF